MRISDWSSDVCSSDLGDADRGDPIRAARSGDHLDGAGERCTPDLVGVVLDHAGAGIMLRQFSLRDAVRCAVGRVEDRAGRVGAFVQENGRSSCRGRLGWLVWNSVGAEAKKKNKRN